MHLHLPRVKHALLAAGISLALTVAFHFFLAERPYLPKSTLRELLLHTRQNGSVPDKDILDVLRLLGTDLDGPDIARQLVVSLHTVRSHTKSIYAKLGVNNRRTAIRRAEELDLLSRARSRP